ncbi:DNA polymerase gamma, mitochondrial, partial [Smittium culicis]
NSSSDHLSGLNESKNENDSAENDKFRSNLLLIAKLPILKFTSEIENKNYEPIPASDTENYYFRIPHKDGESANCGNPLSKNYLSHIENNVLGSSFEISKEAIQMNTLTSYWVSVRKRVIGQFVVPMNDKLKSDHTNPIKSDHLGMILPQLVPMGTITRRGVEPTWATASNAKKNRIGSEIKTLIRSPTICSTETGRKQSFKVVGADVDSEELWISSLMGDAQFGSHGSTALGYMTLLGTKSQGNDMHSATAKILGIDRNNAKVFNYSRIYGAGVKHATQLLCQYNSNITQPDALKLAKNLYLKTKGVKMNSMGFESEFFSLEENDINSEKDKGSLNKATELQQKNLNNVNTNLKKRQFWAGGSESYMFNSLEDVALSDDPRTPVLKCGIVDGLQAKSAGESSVAFFSAVDVDHVLRKETNLDCITPTNEFPIEHGISYDIFQTVNNTNGSLESNTSVPENLKLYNENRLLRNDENSHLQSQNEKGYCYKSASISDKKILDRLTAQMLDSKKEIESRLKIKNNQKYSSIRNENRTELKIVEKAQKKNCANSNSDPMKSNTVKKIVEPKKLQKIGKYTKVIKRATKNPHSQ